jgi:hypothetical protein
VNFALLCVGDSAAEESGTGTGTGTGTDKISRHFTENMEPDIYRMSYVLCQRTNVLFIIYVKWLWACVMCYCFLAM